MRFPLIHASMPFFMALAIVLKTGPVTNLASTMLETGQLPETPYISRVEAPELNPGSASTQQGIPDRQLALPNICETHADTFKTVDKLLKAGRWTDAEVKIHQIRADEPTCPLTTFYLGRIHYYRKNDRQALALFNDLAERHPDIHQTYHYRGLIYSEWGLHTVALEEFAKVMLVNPTIGSGYFFRYIRPFLEKDGRLIPAHSDSVMLYITSPAARALSKGLLAYFKDDYATAVANFRAVIAAEPEHTGAWLYAGLSHDHMRESLQALHCYNRAIALDDTYARAYLMRGLTKINQGNWYRGCRDLRKAHELEHPAADMAVRNFCRRKHFQ